MDAIHVPKEGIATKAVRCNNWHGAFPYTPEVRVSLRHDGNNLYLKYEVTEKYIRAVATHDNDAVWEDSCVEFFIAFDSEGYYNIEANCTGKVLMSHRSGRDSSVEYATTEILDSIQREPSLGVEPFATRKAQGQWILILSIPTTSFFKHNLKSFDGLEAQCNIYKCGDKLPEAHFLSYFPIHTTAPDFHRPDFFGKIVFT